MNKRHTRGRKCSRNRRTIGEEVWSERKEFGKVRRQKGSIEIDKNEGEIVVTLYIEIHNSQQIERYREGVEKLSRGVHSKRGSTV